MRLGLSVNIHCRPMNFYGSTLFALSNVHSADPCDACQLHFFHSVPSVRLGYLTEPMSASAMAFSITLSHSGRITASNMQQLAYIQAHRPTSTGCRLALKIEKKKKTALSYRQSERADAT